MLVKHSIIGLFWILIISFVAASLDQPNDNLQLRSAPGRSSADILRRAFASAATIKRDNSNNSISLDKSWDGAVLFTFKTEAEEKNTSQSAGIEITCTTCYVKGTATGQLLFAENFNATQAFQNFTSAVESDVTSLGSTIANYTENYLEQIDSLSDFNIDHLDNITLPFDLDMNFTDIPECVLNVNFDGLELYVQLDATLSTGATYDLNLYKSETAIGIDVGDLEIGIIFTIDLILSAEAEIDISSGFHIMLNDGVVMNIPMFGESVSNITFNGGKFEFLPVSVQSAGVVLKALLRIGAHAGLDIGTPPFSVFGETFSASTGAEVGIYADIAEFITNITVVPPGHSSECELFVQEVYSMAIGAKAGATVAIDSQTWGPTLNTATPIWYTTLASVCASSSTSSTPLVTARAVNASSLETVTLTTSITYTGVVCLDTTLVNCPVSSQTTSKYVGASTLVTSVPSGSKATFPPTTQNSVVRTSDFGANVQRLSATSGPPVSFVPTASSTPSGSGGSGNSGGSDGSSGGKNNKVIIGVCVGLVLPLGLAIVAGCIYFLRRRRNSSVQPVRAEMVEAEPTLPAPEPDTRDFQVPRKQLPDVAISETSR
ncbi:hypothetical protein EG329_011355 [Mollisiaceae sp. DMI_Dod_QoI]|nr:hypothetical protein EG329_011355 [Helotiales sp. DMI_Dod_QoI]